MLRKRTDLSAFEYKTLCRADYLVGITYAHPLRKFDNKGGFEKNEDPDDGKYSNYTVRFIFD
jgi:hypothetical protein